MQISAKDLGLQVFWITLWVPFGTLSPTFSFSCIPVVLGPAQR